MIIFNNKSFSFTICKEGRVYLSIIKFNQMSKTFKTIKSVPTEGYLQAVSEDGRVCVYKSQELLHIYYFDGDEIISRSFNPGVYIRKVEENYHEEATPFHDIVVRMVDDKIVMFVMEITRRQIIRIQIGDYGRSQPNIKSQQFNFDILDMIFHPTGDCVVALIDKYLVFTLRGDGGATQQIELNTDTEITILNAKLAHIQQNQELLFYSFYIQEKQSSQELKVHKLQERKYLSDYAQKSQTTIFHNDDKSFEHLVGIDYQDGLFTIVRDHINMENLQRSKLMIYMTDELQLLPVTSDGDVTTEYFHSFVEGEKAMLMGRYFSFIASYEDAYLNSICYLPYSSSSQQLKLLPENESCLRGYYDRVSSWVLDGNTYLLTHTDHKLRFYNNAFEEQLETLNAYTFSTKADNMLIVDTYGQLKYLQWGEVDPEEEDPPVEPQNNLLIGIIVMGVCLLAMLFIIIVLCVKMRRTSPDQSNALPDSSDNIINPYLHPPSNYNPSSESKPSKTTEAQMVLAGQKQSK